MILSWDVGMYNLSYCLICKKNKINDVSGNDVSGNDVSGNNVSENDVSGNDVSGNNVSGNNVSGNDVFGNDVSSNNIYKFDNYYIKDWGILNIADKVNLKKNKIGVFSNIIDVLDKYPHFLDCEHVLIENQPCMKNPTMKSIQMIIYSYFLINGCKNSFSKINNVKFISPMNKLKVYDGPEFELKVKSKYSQRKKSAIIHSKYFLQNNPKFLSFFNSNKKNDDLADSLLQGLYFIKNIIEKPPKKPRKKRKKSK